MDSYSVYRRHFSSMNAGEVLAEAKRRFRRSVNRDICREIDECEALFRETECFNLTQVLSFTKSMITTNCGWEVNCLEVFLKNDILRVKGLDLEEDGVYLFLPEVTKLLQRAITLGLDRHVAVLLEKTQHMFVMSSVVFDLPSHHLSMNSIRRHFRRYDMTGMLRLVAVP
jgi:hypothetical protein